MVETPLRRSLRPRTKKPTVTKENLSAARLRAKAAQAKRNRQTKLNKERKLYIPQLTASGRPKRTSTIVNEKQAAKRVEQNAARQRELKRALVKKKQKAGAGRALWGVGLWAPDGQIAMVSNLKIVNVPSSNKFGGTVRDVEISLLEDGVCEIQLSNDSNDLQYVFTRVGRTVSKRFPSSTRLLRSKFCELWVWSTNVYYLMSPLSTGISVEELSVLQSKVQSNANIPDIHKLNIIAGLFRYKFALDGSHRAVAHLIGSQDRDGNTYVALRPAVAPSVPPSPPLPLNPDVLITNKAVYNSYFAQFAVHVTEDRMSAGIHLLSGLNKSGLLYLGQKNFVYIRAPDVPKTTFRALFKQFVRGGKYESKPVISKIMSINNANNSNLNPVLQFMDGVHDFVGSRTVGTGVTSAARNKFFTNWYTKQQISAVANLINTVGTAADLEECFREFIIWLAATKPAGILVDTHTSNDAGLMENATKHVLPNGGAYTVDVLVHASAYTSTLHLVLFKFIDMLVNRPV